MPGQLSAGEPVRPVMRDRHQPARPVPAAGPGAWYSRAAPLVIHRIERGESEPGREARRAGWRGSVLPDPPTPWSRGGAGLDVRGGAWNEGTMERGNAGRRFSAGWIIAQQMSLHSGSSVPSFPRCRLPPTAPASPARRQRHPPPAGSPSSPCRWCRLECATRGSRNRRHRWLVCRPSAAEYGRR